MTSVRTRQIEFADWLGRIPGKSPLVAYLGDYPGLMQLSPETTSVPFSLPGECLVYFLRNGSLHIDIDGHNYEMAPGSLLCLPLGARFRYRTTRESGAKLLRFRIRGLPDGLKFPFSPVLSQAWDLESVVSRIVNELESETPFAPMMVNHCLHQLLILAARHQLTPNSGRRLSTAERSKLRKLVDDCWPQPVTARRMARELGLTHDYFSRVFKRTFTLSPRAWVIEERIRRSAHILAGSDASVKEVAKTVGYDNWKLFSRQFAKIMGQPPGRWRKSPEASPA